MRAPARLLAALLLGGGLCAGAGALEEPPYPHAAEPIGTVREVYDGTLAPALAVSTFRNFDRLFPARRVPHARARPLDAGTPLPPVRLPAAEGGHGLDAWLEGNRIAGLLVLHRGRIAAEIYRYGNGERTRWMSMSVAKSVTSTLVGIALGEGRIGALADPVTRYAPVLSGSAWDAVSVRDVLTMSSGLGWAEAYTDPSSDRRRLLEAQIAQRPGAAMALMRGLTRVAPPGTRHNYSTGETQVAAEVLRGAVGMPLADYLAARIWGPAGMEADATWCLDSPEGVEIGGSALNATLRDYGRFGLFVLAEGRPEGARALPRGWVAEASAPATLADGTRIDYGYLWWPATRPALRADAAFAAVGIHGQFLFLNPARELVVVVWGAQSRPSGGNAVDDWAFFEAISALYPAADAAGGGQG